MTAGAAEGGAPVLTTARLVLRSPVADDLDFSTAMWADPAVVRHTSGTPLPREDVWRRLLMYRGLWSMLGYGYWIVCRQSDGAAIGEVGFADFRRGLGPCLDGIPEIGWSFASDGQGQGFAQEAAMAAMDWIERQRPGAPVGCLIHCDNLRSLKLAARLGFQESARLDYRSDPVIVLRRSSPVQDRK